MEWLLSSAAGAAGRKVLKRSDARRALDQVVTGAIDAAVQESVAPDLHDQVRDALGVHIPARSDLKIDDVTDVAGVVRRWLAPLAEADDQFNGASYLETMGVDAHRLGEGLAAEVRRRLDERARVDAALKPLVDELRHKETIWHLRMLQAESGGALHDADVEFERRYIDYLARTLSGFELFGVTRGRASNRQSYEDAYIGLAVARADRGPGADDDELTGAGIDAVSAFAQNRRVLLRGGAGAGKTTLLRWLAGRVAGGALGTAAGQWGAAIPLLVPLRQVTGSELPDPDDLLSAVDKYIAGEAPTGWARDQFRSGRALLLVDGVDEVAAERRLDVRDWLTGLASFFPDAHYVVTTRPFAVDESWLSDSGFVRYDLLPMSAKGIQDYIARWHDAARAQHAADSEMRQWLDQCQDGLSEQLSRRLELRRLAASPLLCGLLCALYQDGNMHLPQDRKGLYDAALDLLLVRWDEQRNVRLGEDPALSKEEQIVLLQRFAYSFVKNQDILVSRQDAVHRFTHAMRGLRPHHASPQMVLQRTLERTGLLREPSPDQVQFVHRTFRDYLAAKEIVDAGDLSHLIEHAHLDQWHDVAVMAIAHARPRERDRILQDLLKGNTEARRSTRVRDRLHLVAAACLEQADVVDTDEVRQQVQEAAARLIPPATPDEAELLSRAGPFVLDLLPGPIGLSEDQAACVIRTAAMIGGVGAREKIAKFTGIDKSVVIQELLRAWRQSDNPEDYARTVLADVDFGDLRVDVRGSHRARQLKHLTRLTNLGFRGDLLSLDPIAAVPNLRRLDLLQNEMLRDLSPLAGCRSLRVLALSLCTRLRDLSPLAETAVEELSLHLMRADLATLSGVRLRSLTIRDATIADGLHPLPSDLPLREFTADNRPAERSLIGIERWSDLEKVSLLGIPRPDEVAALAELPHLRHLVIRQPETTSELTRLAPLTSLSRLEIIADASASTRADLSAVLEPLLPGTQIHQQSP